MCDRQSSCTHLAHLGDVGRVLHGVGLGGCGEGAGV